MVTLILLLFLLIYLSTLCTAPALIKAGVPAQKAFTPFVNTLELVKLTGRPTRQAFLVYLPVFNFFLLFSLLTDLSRSFKKDSFGDYFKAMVIPIYHFPRIAKTETYIGKTSELPKQAKSTAREWADSIVFAVLAATLIRWSTFEAYTIPTSSMEGTMLVGDYLFVSKLHYGPRSPITPLQVPLTHQNLWFTGNPDGTGGVKSYMDWLQLPYFRFPGITEIKRNDIVVFNWPWDNGKDTYVQFGSLAKADLRPMDLKTNYVKRCVAVGGDTLEVKDENILINGKISEINGVIQHAYEVTYDTTHFIAKYGPLNYQSLVGVGTKICDQVGVRVERTQNQLDGNVERTVNLRSRSSFIVNMTQENAQAIRKMKLVKGVVRTEVHKGQDEYRAGTLYPAEKSWTLDDYGPIVMPKKGMTFQVNKDRLIMWERALTYFEGDNVEIKDNMTKLFVDGKEVQEYTFKQNYYYMIGDNRHGSYDSRTWGFVPENHVVGTPLMIWMSKDDNPNKSWFESIRWNRIFNFVR